MRNKLRIVWLIWGIIACIYCQLLIIKALNVYNGFTYACLVAVVVCSSVHVELAIVSESLDKIRRNKNKQQKEND